MTAPSPARQTGRQLNLSITAAGAVVHSDRIVSVETWSQANRIPRARLILHDGDPATGAFPLSASKLFVPGAAIVIAAGYGSQSETLHQGIVIRHGVRIVPGRAAQLEIETADPLLKMTLARHSVVTSKSNDAAVIEALVSANGGRIGTNHAATTEVEAIVQAAASDWELMLLRAEASGCVAVIDNKTVDIVSPSAPGNAVLELAYGDAIISFDAAIDASGVLGASAVSSRAWSYADQQIAKGSAEDAEVKVPGNLDAATLAKVMGVGAFPQQTAALQSETALASWSSATLMRARLAQVVGTAKVQGNAKLRPATHVALAGLGDRFNGDVFVGGVRHEIKGNDWHSVVELGLPAERFASRERPRADPAASGLTAPLRGLQTGLVKQVAEDPTGDFRVLVTLPLIDEANGIWARLAQPYASKGFGWSFFPEENDEVVVAFMNEDPASAVVIASVFSSGRAPAHSPVKTNDLKALVTRSKMEVSFNDKDTILTIKTPGGRRVVLDDKAGSITVADNDGNKLVMTKDKMDLVSAGAMAIKSTGAMTIKSGGTLSVEATGATDVTAPSVEVTGKSNLALVSKGVGSLKAATQLEVKGALVRIN